MTTFEDTLNAKSVFSSNVTRAIVVEFQGEMYVGQESLGGRIIRLTHELGGAALSEPVLLQRLENNGQYAIKYNKLPGGHEIEIGARKAVFKHVDGRSKIIEHSDAVRLLFPNTFDGGSAKRLYEPLRDFVAKEFE